METLQNTIKNITRNHLLNNNSVLLAQSLYGPGAIQGTLPDYEEIKDHLIELPISDLSNSGVVTGWALAGKRPIYCIRYAGFLWINAANLVNYCAISKSMWGAPAPCFVRIIGVEGGAGPTASRMHHSMLCKIPCVKVYAPITSEEYQETWDDFMSSDEIMFCHEHRLTYKHEEEVNNQFIPFGKCPTIVAIGYARINAIKAIKILKEKNIRVNLFNLWKLKPLVLDDSIGIASSKVLVIDSDYEFGGFGSQVALECHKRYNLPVDVMGLEDRVAGTAPHCDVLTPSAERIVNYFV